MRNPISLNVICLLFCVSACLASSVPKQFSKPVIEPVISIYAVGERDSDPPAIGKYDCGIMSKSKIKSKTLTHVFIFRNASSQPASIDLLMPTCDCVSAKPAAASQHLPKTLKPAEIFKVKMTIDLSKVQIGPLKKEVWGFTNGNRKRVAVILRFTGTAVK